MEEKQTRSPLREEQLWLLTGGVLMLAFVAFSFAMYFTRSFMIPFVFSVFLCAMLSPVDNLIVVRWKYPRWVGFIASLFVVMLLFLCIFLVGKYAIGSINQAIKEVTNTVPVVEEESNLLSPSVLNLSPTAIPDSTELLLPSSKSASVLVAGQNTPEVVMDSAGSAQVSSEAEKGTGTLAEEISTEGPNISAGPAPAKKTTFDVIEESIDSVLSNLGISQEYVTAKTFISSIYSYIPAILRESISTCQTFISFSMMVLLYSIFILMGRNPHVRAKNEVYREIESSMQKYLNIKFFISFMTGVCIYLVFLMLGVQMAFLFGLLAFVLNFIPSIGSIIATILPIPIIMITEEMSHTGLFLAFSLPCLVQNFLGNFLDPKMQGEGLQLHPVTILLALGYWGVVWGVFGMLLAAPMTAALRVVLLEFKTTNWIAQLMGGQMPTMAQVLEMKDAD